jgi:uncharacterized protein with GYD domain
MARRSRQAKHIVPKRGSHVYYLLQYAYTTEAWRALVENTTQRDRAGAIRELLRKFDACLARIDFECAPHPHPTEKLVLAGDHDVVAFAAFPNPRAATAFSMAVLATGTVKYFRATPAVPMRQAIEAMELAGAARRDTLLSYRGPGEKR